MQVEVDKIKNAQFAILVWYIQEGKEDKAKVYSGMANWNEAANTLEIYRESLEKPSLELTGEQLDRIKLVTPKIKETLLGAEYYIALTMGDLPGNDTEGFNKVGLKW